MGARVVGLLGSALLAALAMPGIAAAQVGSGGLVSIGGGGSGGGESSGESGPEGPSSISAPAQSPVSVDPANGRGALLTIAGRGPLMNGSAMIVAPQSQVAVGSSSATGIVMAGTAIGVEVTLPRIDGPAVLVSAPGSGGSH